MGECGSGTRLGSLMRVTLASFASFGGHREVEAELGSRFLLPYLLLT